jgi:hypothetical protein
MTRELSSYEQWMVKSNLETISSTNVTAAEQVALLRSNGYERVAQAVEHASRPLYRPLGLGNADWARLKARRR